MRKEALQALDEGIERIEDRISTTQVCIEDLQKDIDSMEGFQPEQSVTIADKRMQIRTFERHLDTQQTRLNTFSAEASSLREKLDAQ